MQQRIKIHFHKVQVKLSVLELTEIQYLIDKTLQNAHITVSNLHHHPLRVRQVWRMHKLANRLGYQRKRCAQIVRHIGEEYELRIGGVAQLTVQLLLLVASANCVFFRSNSF